MVKIAHYVQQPSTRTITRPDRCAANRLPAPRTATISPQTLTPSLMMATIDDNNRKINCLQAERANPSNELRVLSLAMTALRDV
jgi:hypothetical protein